MNILKYIIKKWREIALFLVILFLAILVYRNTSLKQELSFKTHNIEVLTDSLHSWKTKEGEWLFEKGLIITENKESLEKLTSLKNSEIKQLEKELSSKLLLISQLTGEIDLLKNNIKELEVSLEEGKDSLEYKLKFNFNDSWRTIEGYTLLQSYEKPISFNTYLTKDIINLNLKTGLTQDFHIFITSDCPYININSIDGAIIDPSKFSSTERPKRWYFGPVAGYGYNIGPNKFGIFLGFGIGYGIVRW